MAASNGPSTTGNHANVVPSEVGWQFVPQYYTFVNKSPNRLHMFYTKNSTFIHGTEGEDGRPCYGQQEIHNKILSIGFQDCKVYIHSVDAQASAAGGIIIQVIGEMSNHGEPWRKFAQTFFLAEQPNGYFVLNDIFRFLKEDSAGDDEEQQEGEPAAPEPAQQEPLPSPAPVPAPVAAPAVTVPEPAPAPREPTPPPPAPEPVAAPPVIDVAHPEPAPAPTPEPVAPAPAPAPVEEKLVNGHAHPEPPKAPTPEPVTVAEAVKKPTPAPSPSPTPAPASTKSASPAPPAPAAVPAVEAPKPVEPAKPVEPPKPAEPPKPKTWANLAAANSTAWGAAAAKDVKGVSAAPAPRPPVPRPVAAPVAAPSQPASGTRTPAEGEHPNYTAAMALTTGQCFVKGVTEGVSTSVLREVLTTRFGPIKELDIVRSKACAFLEFATADSARRAVVVCLPIPQGGEGGIRIEGAGENGGPQRITVEARKERGERPPPRPRGGAPINGDVGRGGFRGRGGPPPARGRGGPVGK